MKQLDFLKPSLIPSRLLEIGLIAAALVLPFGIQISRLGLYGDDWASVLLPGANRGFSTLDELTKTALIQLAGSQPSLYHLVTILLLFIIGLLLHNVLIQIGLDRVSAVAGVLLFLLFPGFLQPASGLVLFNILIGLVFTFLSFLFYLKWLEVSPGRIYFLVIGLICSTLSLVISPYSAVLTSFTFLFLIPRWQDLHNNEKVHFVILGIGLLIGGLVSVLLFATGKSNLDSALLIRTVRVWLESFIISWRQVLAVPQAGSKTIIYILVMIFTIIVLIWIFKKIERAGGKPEENLKLNTCTPDIFRLICSMLAGFGYILLMIIAGFPIEIHYPKDISMVVLGIMASIFIVLGIKLIFLSKYRLFVLAMLIVLAGGARYSLINRFVHENSRVEDLLAQLAVRGDQFKTGTVLISEQLPMDYTSPKAIDALIQNKFKGEIRDTVVNYTTTDIPEIREFFRENNQNDTTLLIDDRKILIEKVNIIGFWVQPNGCMLFLDENSERSGLPEELKYVSLYSNPELFFSGSLSDVIHLFQFRTKIENEWCFYYQLANRQVTEKKWKEVLQTYRDAKDQGLTPKSFYDSLPILSASMHENFFPQAKDISREFISQPELKKIICNLWENYRTEPDLPEEVVSEVKQAQNVVGCP